MRRVRPPDDAQERKANGARLLRLLGLRAAGSAAAAHAAPAIRARYAAACAAPAIRARSSIHATAGAPAASSSSNPPVPRRAHPRPIMARSFVAASDRAPDRQMASLPYNSDRRPSVPSLQSVVVARPK